MNLEGKGREMKAKHSLRGAINAKCKDCTYDPALGMNWKKQVTMCAVIDCPLWPVRPVSSVQGASDPHNAQAMAVLVSLDPVDAWKRYSGEKTEPDVSTSETVSELNQTACRVAGTT